VDEVLFEKVQRNRAAASNMPLKTWSRACTIVPEFVGQKFDVHNGRTFIQVYVTEDMVGHKLGEFAPTRTFKGHTTREVKK
jgi:small subunit ribosomal protein S19